MILGAPHVQAYGGSFFPSPLVVGVVCTLYCSRPRTCIWTWVFCCWRRPLCGGVPLIGFWSVLWLGVNASWHHFLYRTAVILGLLIFIVDKLLPRWGSPILTVRCDISPHIFHSFHESFHASMYWKSLLLYPQALCSIMVFCEYCGVLRFLRWSVGIAVGVKGWRLWPCWWLLSYGGRWPCGGLLSVAFSVGSANNPRPSPLHRCASVYAVHLKIRMRLWFNWRKSFWSTIGYSCQLMPYWRALRWYYKTVLNSLCRCWIEQTCKAHGVAIDSRFYTRSELFRIECLIWIRMAALCCGCFDSVPKTWADLVLEIIVA